MGFYVFIVEDRDGAAGLGHRPACLFHEVLARVEVLLLLIPSIVPMLPDDDHLLRNAVSVGEQGEKLHQQVITASAAAARCFSERFSPHQPSAGLQAPADRRLARRPRQPSARCCGSRPWPRAAAPGQSSEIQGHRAPQPTRSQCHFRGPGRSRCRPA